MISLAFFGADAMDILQRDHDALVGRKIDASDTSHVVLLLLPALPAVVSAPGPAERTRNAATTPAPRPGPASASCLCKTDAGY